MANEATVRFETMTHGGEALGRQDGRAVFAAGPLPGETARVSIVEEKKGFARGRLVEVLEPGEDRVAPPCPHFGLCGGCQWQHASYAAQLEYKQRILVDQLRRIGGFVDAADLVRPAIGMINPWGYRNNARFSIDPATGAVGFQRSLSHDVEPIVECRLLERPIEAAFESLKGQRQAWDAPSVTIRHSARSGDLLIHPRLPGVTEPASGQLFYFDELLGHPFRISAGSFFQVNTVPEQRDLPATIRAPWVPQRSAEWSMAELLALIVLDRLPAERLGRVIDAYSGVGTFAILLADGADEVVAIEEVPSAVSDARFNARELPNIRLVLGSVERELPRLKGPIDAAVLDPARAGCHPAVLNALVAARPPRIVYVSCDPATLSRDLKRLAVGGYSIDSVEPVDLFPQTFHVECVTTLSLA